MSGTRLIFFTLCFLHCVGLLAGDLKPDQSKPILLNAHPLYTSRSAQSLRQAAPHLAGKELHLIQFAGPIQPEWYAALQSTRVKIVAYIPFYSYLVYGDGNGMEEVQRLSLTKAVQWDGEYLAEYKIHPRALPGGRKNTPDYFDVQLVEDAATNASTLAFLDSIKKGPLRISRALAYVNVKIRFNPNKVFAVAARSDVVSILPYSPPAMLDERQDQILAGNLVGNAPTGPGYLGFLASAGFAQNQFTTSGFGVDVTDSGIDNGTIAPNHFALYVNGNTTLASRVVYNRLVGSPNSGSTLQGCDGHGNLNSHILAGYSDFSSGFPHEDASGYDYDLGVCPFVKVGSSVIFDPDFTFPDYEDLQSMAYADGMRISTNSWGQVPGDGSYSSDAQRYDALVRDAQPSGSSVPNAGNQEMVIVFAAGNGGSASNTVAPPGTAKNVISVGASENAHPFGGADRCGDGDADADSANDIIFFSGRGPTDDLRAKPDIVGPGTHVSGGVGQSVLASNPPAGNGSALACFDASGVCGGPASSHFWPLSQEWTTASSGTSHSAPAVSGGAALLRQYFINHGIAPPSPAMTRAYLVNSARYMTGVSAGDTLPSPNQGMGSMNLGAAFDGISRILKDEMVADKFTASGQSRVLTGNITDNTKPFRVTLAWIDPPGPTSGSAFVNDLDLEVIVNGNTYTGNVFNGATSISGGSADPRNNLESVFLPAGISGPFAIRIRASNIAGDGVPGDADPLDQDFALVCYNCVEVSQPLIQAPATAITSENCAPPNNSPDPGETVTISVSLQNVGAEDTTNLVATLEAGGNVTLPSGPQNYGAISAGGSAVSRDFTFTVDGAASCGDILTLTFDLQDGATNLGTIVQQISIGAFGSAIPYSYTGPAIAIPDSSPTGADTNVLVYDFPGAIVDLDLRIDGSSCDSAAGSQTAGVDHTFVGDLIFTLTSPHGTSATIINRPGAGNFGSSGNNFCQTLLDDESTGPNIDDILDAGAPPLGPPYTGSFQPQSLLSVFDGEDPNGTWTLHVTDNTTSDTGHVRAYSILLNQFQCCGQCPAIVLAPGSLSEGNSGAAYHQDVIANGGTSPFTYSVTAGTLPSGLNLDINTGAITGTPTTEETQNFTITATDSTGCSGNHAYTVSIGPPCLFCDDFEDGILSNLWTYDKPASWSEPAGGSLVGISGGKKSVAIAASAFPGCGNCFVESTMESSGGNSGVWILGWYVDKKTHVELQMKEKSNKWTLIEHFNGRRKKAKAIRAIDPNIFYRARIAFNGSQFDVTIDGAPLLSLTALGPHNGTFGFQVKGGTAHFGEIIVN